MVALLSSGCRTGQKLAASMANAREEVTTLCAYLEEEELPSLYSSELAGLGQGRKDGSSRALMVRGGEAEGKVGHLQPI